jgi:hypothetical protein
VEQVFLTQQSSVDILPRFGVLNLDQGGMFGLHLVLNLLAIIHISFSFHVACLISGDELWAESAPMLFGLGLAVQVFFGRLVVIMHEEGL